MPAPRGPALWFTLALLLAVSSAAGEQPATGNPGTAQRAQALASTYLQRVPAVDDATKLRLVHEAQVQLEQCVKMLDACVASDPALASVALAPVPGSSATSVGQLHESCRAMLATLASATPAPPVPETTQPAPAEPPATASPEPIATPAASPAESLSPVQRLDRAAELFSHGSDTLNAGISRIKAKTPFAAIEADDLLFTAERELAQVQSVFDEVLTAEPELKSHMVADGDNRLKAGLMQSSTKIRLERATQKRGQLKPRLKKDQVAWTAAFKKAIKGARLQAFKQHGVPADFDGNAPEMTPAEKLKEIPGAARWRYLKDGCTTEFLFDGSQLKEIRKQPADC
ncbi:MAG: hypothetical protein ABIJ09_03755 [Pseudomonadota bacterium]